MPILTDEDGALYLPTLNQRIGIEDGKVWLEDGVTGENLLTNVEAQRARRVAEERANVAEAQTAAEAEARRAAEARAAEAEARLAALEAHFRAQQEQNNKV